MPYKDGVIPLRGPGPYALQVWNDSEGKKGGDLLLEITP